MINREDQLRGQKALCEKIKATAQKAYYNDPNYCLFCKKVIELNGYKPSVVKLKKFCNSSCAAKYNNALVPKRKAVKSGECKSCGKTVFYSKHPDGSYYKRKFCDSCLPAERTRKAKEGTQRYYGCPPQTKESQCERCGIPFVLSKKDSKCGRLPQKKYVILAVRLFVL